MAEDPSRPDRRRDRQLRTQINIAARMLHNIARNPSSSIALDRELAALRVSNPQGWGTRDSEDTIDRVSNREMIRGLSSFAYESMRVSQTLPPCEDITADELDAIVRDMES